MLHARRSAVLVATIAFLAVPLLGQSQSASVYPQRPGIFFFDGITWHTLPAERPTKVRAKHSLFTSLTDGAVGSPMVAEYVGSHAQVTTAATTPIICFCHIVGMAGDPLMVKLQSKKKTRELDGGKLHLGAKQIAAQSKDFVPVNVDHPDENVTIIKPSHPLLPGDYAVMRAPGDLLIFAFTVLAPAAHHQTIPSSSSR